MFDARIYYDMGVVWFTIGAGYWAYDKATGASVSAVFYFLIVVGIALIITGIIQARKQESDRIALDSKRENERNRRLDEMIEALRGIASKTNAISQKLGVNQLDIKMANPEDAKKDTHSV